MSSQPRPQNPCSFHFEFDRINGILLARFDGVFTLASVAKVYEAIRQYAVATDPRAGILDLTNVTDFDIASEEVRQIANEEPAFSPGRPSVIVAPAAAIYGMARMFQLVGDRKRPLLSVVHTMHEALATLGVRTSQFEPLEDRLAG